MEFDLLKICLDSRDSYDRVVRFINIKQYTRDFQHIFTYVSDYYKRDSAARSVRVDTLLEQIRVTTDNEKHVEHFKNFLERSLASDVSVANVEAVLIAAREREIGLKLSIALAEGRSSDVASLLPEYQSARSASVIEDLEGQESEAEVLENINVEDLIHHRKDRSNLFPLYPKSVGDRVDGGVEAGDSLLVFGLTEIGKSMFSIHHACGWANCGKPGLYLINEDRAQRIASRIVSNLSNMDRYSVEADPRKAHQRAYEAGLGNIRVVQLHPGSPAVIERLIEKYEPSWIVVDQLRNLNTGTRNNKVVQLEEAATAMRNIGKKYKIVTLNVTQAGESARNKIFLDTGDVDFSNVGIPGQADVMMGIGCNEEMEKRGERGVSLCKNKISGDHAQVIVKVNPGLSRLSSYT